MRKPIRSSRVNIARASRYRARPDPATTRGRASVRSVRAFAHSRRALLSRVSTCPRRRWTRRVDEVIHDGSRRRSGPLRLVVTDASLATLAFVRAGAGGAWAGGTRRGRGAVVLSAPRAGT